MEIKVYKLLTGEELIGEEVEVTPEGIITVKRPLGLAINHEERRLVFVPYMPYTSATEEIAIPFSSLLHEPLTPIDSIAADYKETIAKLFPTILVPERSIIRPA